MNAIRDIIITPKLIKKYLSWNNQGIFSVMMIEAFFESKLIRDCTRMVIANTKITSATD
jgi:hypothetical protein